MEFRFYVENINEDIAEAFRAYIEAMCTVRGVEDYTISYTAPEKEASDGEETT